MMVRPRGLTALLIGAGLACAVALARATTVVPPTFAELVAGAQTVFVGETLDVRSQWVSSPSRPIIITLVTFRVERTIKGQLGGQTVLEFLGGTVGEDRLEVGGMPKFRPGDRDVLFVDDRGRQVSPIVGFMHGRFRLTRDGVTGRELVSQYNFDALSSVDEIGRPGPARRVAAARPMTLDDFAAEITRALGRAQAGR